MSWRAWLFVGGTLIVGCVVVGWSGTFPFELESDLPAFLALAFFATLAIIFKALFKSTQSEQGTTTYSPKLIFLFAGVFLLSPPLFSILVIVPHVIELINERRKSKVNLAAWYIQPFNVATHVLAGLATMGLLGTLIPETARDSALSLILAAGLVMVYVLFNHYLVGQALVLARSVSWRQSGVWARDNLINDGVMMAMGYGFVVLWRQNPWLIAPALVPLVLIRRALMVPQLKKEARTDSKTGLWNAHHFAELFNGEMERARRFNRPLVFIMADLDLLRNVNNTYGHVAGDAVLVKIGKIINSTMRQYDIAGRFGGEEFAIVIPEASEWEAVNAAERLRKAVESTDFVIPTHTEPIRVTMSLGIACFPNDATGATDLIHQADVAVYQAKFNGRNRAVSAADLPQSVRLGTISTDRLEATIPISVSTREFLYEHERVVAHSKDAALAPKTVVIGAETDQAPAQPLGRRIYPRWFLPAFVSSVTLAGLLVTAFGVSQPAQIDWSTLAGLVVLAVVTEWWQVSLYGINTISVSLAATFAAAILIGIPGVAVTSAAIALTHYVKNQPPAYRTPFNWATHVLAGAIPALAFRAFTLSFEIANLIPLFLIAVITALVYYIVESGLISTAIAISTNTRVVARWRGQFQWLTVYYVVLCVMALFLTLAYRYFGIEGALVFASPIFMIRLAQKQFIDRTTSSMREWQRMNQELTIANQEIINASDSIRDLNDELFQTLAKILDARDPFVSGHAVHVARYATAIATEMGLTPERTETVRQAAYLHDIGKIAIAGQVLHKTTQLTTAEYDYVKKHVVLGAELLQTSHGLRHLVPAVKHHHERWDGTGYPTGLKGDLIPLEARILAVCDAVETMASDRPYRSASSVPEILAELARMRGAQFDPRVVEAFERVVEREGAVFIVNSAREVRQKRSDTGITTAFDLDFPTWLEDPLS